MLKHHNNLQFTIELAQLLQQAVCDRLESYFPAETKLQQLVGSLV